MKKGFIFGGLVCVIGLILISIAYAFKGESAFHLEENKVEKNYIFDGDYKNIIFDEKNKSIVVKRSPDEKVYLKTYESNTEYYDITEGEDLKIEYKNNWFNKGINLDFNWIFNFNKFNCELYIPENMNLNLVLENVNGSIYVYDVNVNSLSVNGKNGSITIEDVTTIEDLEVYNKNGNINVEEVKVRKGNINNKNGSININTVDGNSVKTSNKNGNIYIQDIYSNNNINVDNTNGKIDFNNIDFEYTLEMNSTNGGITGSLGDLERNYSFDLKTTNGKVELNNVKVDNYKSDLGNKKVIVKTTNGNINILTK